MDINDEEALLYWISANLDRRHLTKGQIEMLHVDVTDLLGRDHDADDPRLRHESVEMCRKIKEEDKTLYDGIKKGNYNPTYAYKTLMERKHSAALAARPCMEEAGKLRFRCKNSFHPTTNTENLSKGIGLENVKKRLQLIYPDAHQLEISCQGEEYEVQLAIQLTKLKRV